MAHIDMFTLVLAGVLIVLGAWEWFKWKVGP